MNTPTSEDMKVSYLRSLEAFTKIRPSLTPEDQIIFDKVQEIWIMIDKRTTLNPTDGKAVAIQAATTTLILALQTYDSTILHLLFATRLMHENSQLHHRLKMADDAGIIKLIRVKKEEGNVETPKTVQ